MIVLPLSPRPPRLTGTVSGWPNLPKSAEFMELERTKGMRDVKYNRCLIAGHTFAVFGAVYFLRNATHP